MCTHEKRPVKRAHAHICTVAKTHKMVYLCNAYVRCSVLQCIYVYVP